jgi:hypothetical protein
MVNARGSVRFRPQLKVKILPLRFVIPIPCSRRAVSISSSSSDDRSSGFPEVMR